MIFQIELTEKQYEMIITALTDKIRSLESDNAVLRYNADTLREKLKEAEAFNKKTGVVK